MYLHDGIEGYMEWCEERTVHYNMRAFHMEFKRENETQ